MEVTEKLDVVNLHSNIYFDKGKFLLQAYDLVQGADVSFIYLTLLLSGPLLRVYNYKDNGDSWGS